MLQWIRDHLVEDAKYAWKWLSVRLAALVVIAPLLYESSDQIQAVLPPSVFRYAMSVLGVLVILGRIKKQNPSS